MKRDNSERLENLSRWMDGELNTHETEMLESRIDLDAFLKNNRDVWMEIRSNLRMDAGELPKPAMVAADWAELESMLPTRRSWKNSRSMDHKLIHFPWVWVGGFAAMAATVAISIGVWVHDTKPAPDLGNAFADLDSEMSVSFVETDIPGASSMVYVDESSGWTIVWVTDPQQSILSSSAS